MRFEMRKIQSEEVDVELIIAVLGLVLLCGAGLTRLVPERYKLTRPCTFHEVTGYPCLSCGGTRAARAIGRLEFRRALAFNPLIAGWLLLAAPHALWVLLARWRGLPRPRLRPERRADRVFLWMIPVVLLAANWTYLVAAGI
jgi:hypothetical protein